MFSHSIDPLFLMESNRMQTAKAGSEYIFKKIPLLKINESAG